MPFFQFNMIISRMIMGGLIIISSLICGCVSQNGQTASMEDQPAAAESTEAAVDKAAAATGDTAAGQGMITAIDARATDTGVEVLIQGDTSLKRYTTIKQAFPFGVAVYLSETGISEGLAPNSSGADMVQDIKVGYADQANTTAKVEILLKQDVSYTVEQDGGLLKLDFTGEQERSQVLSLTGNPGQPPKTAQFVSETTGSQTAVSGGQARLTDISFDTEQTGRSTIFVETSRPVNYDLVAKSGRLLSLNLYDTVIPEVHQRPLSTRYFDSAVEQILPGQLGPGSKDGAITIQIREPVPYRVFQEQNRIFVVFEPSSVKPPAFSKARVDLNSDVPVQQASSGQPKDTDDGRQLASSSERDSVTEDIDSLTGSGERQYTGEKIKLDFFDTDIRNVFKIIKTVSGYNFAIDNDVRGRVTLSLEDPVPWDQVLDLVLKMNQLGKKREGNVYRIASLETIKDEEEKLQAAIDARKKSLEDKKSLEPIYTEFIAINYADALEISKHIYPVLSKDEEDKDVDWKTKPEITDRIRGAMTIDTRTNTIIITDIREKLDHAYEIIKQLDRVTPQIIIEARVVEVSKSFTRSLGIGWNLSNASGTTSGFVDDFNLSLNSSGVAGDFSFFNIAGSSVAALNAQLEASEEKGDAKIVSSPRILTLDNKTASIKQGQEYAYLERDDSGGSSVEYKDIDLLLEVTPHVTPDDRISMKVTLTKNDVTDIESTSGAPILSTNEATTELLVNNKDTLVIGGIVKTTEDKQDQGLPFLSGIPVLGALFGTQTKNSDRDELLIFITPTIVQLEQRENRKIRREAAIDPSTR